jgi:hypothetical protein
VVDDLDGEALLVGRVVAAHVSRRVLLDDDADPGQVLAASPLLAYAHPGRVAAVQRSKPFPYHPGFRD